MRAHTSAINLFVCVACDRYFILVAVRLMFLTFILSRISLTQYIFICVGRTFVSRTHTHRCEHENDSEPLVRRLFLISIIQLLESCEQRKTIPRCLKWPVEKFFFFLTSFGFLLSNICAVNVETSLIKTSGMKQEHFLKERRNFL